MVAYKWFCKKWVDGDGEVTVSWVVVVVVRTELGSIDFGSRSDVALLVVWADSMVGKRRSRGRKVGESCPGLKEGRRVCQLIHWRNFFFSVNVVTVIDSHCLIF